MFPLAGSSYPKSSDELAKAIIDGSLAPVFRFPPGNTALAITGDFPALEKVQLNLTGASVDANKIPPRPRPAGPREPGVTVDVLDAIAHPLSYGASRLNFELHATGVRFDFSRDAGGHPLLLLSGANDGSIEASIAMADLQAALLQAASMAGAQHGVAIQELNVRLTSAGPRSVMADVRVKAKKSILSGVVQVRGRLDIDSELNAVLSGLACNGEGMVGTMAAGVIQGKLKSIEGRRFPLLAISLGDVTLRDVSISADDPLRVKATFGKPAASAIS